MQQTTLELLAGVEGTSAHGAAANAIGTSALFTSITAIGLDYDAPEATTVIVGDGSAVRMINVFTRQVRPVVHPTPLMKADLPVWGRSPCWEPLAMCPKRAA